jgi:hypothetical protein
LWKEIVSIVLVELLLAATSAYVTRNIADGLLDRARRDLYIINNFGDFRNVQNEISRVLAEPVRSESQAQPFVADLNRASDRILEVLEELAQRLNPMHGIVQQPRIAIEPGLAGGFKRPSTHSTSTATNLISNGTDPIGKGRDSLGIAQPGNATESDRSLEYCIGAVSMQKNPARVIESIANAGKPGMQFTYVCKFCFLQISNYHHSVKAWTSYQWACLAKSHLVASSSYLDPRAFFKCIECDHYGTATIIKEPVSFTNHIETSHPDVDKRGGNPKKSAYSKTAAQLKEAQPKLSYAENVALWDKEIAALDAELEKEFAEDGKVKKARQEAITLEDDDDEDKQVGPRDRPTPKPITNESSTRSTQQKSAAAKELQSATEQHKVSPLESSDDEEYSEVFQAMQKPVASPVVVSDPGINVGSIQRLVLDFGEDRLEKQPATRTPADRSSSASKALELSAQAEVFEKDGTSRVVPPNLPNTTSIPGRTHAPQVEGIQGHAVGVPPTEELASHQNANSSHPRTEKNVVDELETKSRASFDNMIRPEQPITPVSNRAGMNPLRWSDELFLPPKTAPEPPTRPPPPTPQRPIQRKPAPDQTHGDTAAQASQREQRPPYLESPRPQPPSRPPNRGSSSQAQTLNRQPSPQVPGNFPS